MGRGQVVRQRVLVSLFGGSSPSVPDPFLSKKPKVYSRVSLRTKAMKHGAICLTQACRTKNLFLLIRTSLVLSSSSSPSH